MMDWSSVKLGLAPMAGYTDLAYRRLATTYGMDFSTTEMVSIRALYYNDKKTWRLMRVAEDEAPVSLQLFGDDPKIMSAAIEKIAQTDTNYLSIDINMGCPAPKIVKSGAGSALLNNEKLAYDIMASAVEVSPYPVSVKIRKGFELDGREGLKIAKLAEEAGVSYICVHGRTTMQYYSGEADRDFTQEVAESLSIPVLGNGDVLDAIDVKDYISRGCKGVTIGRGAIGRPTIFKEIKDELNGKHPAIISPRDKFKIAKQHFLMMLEEKVERQSVVEMRKHMIGYLHGMKNNKVLKQEYMSLNRRDEVLQWLDRQMEAQSRS